MPVISLINKNFEREGYLERIILEKTGIKKEDIIDFDLYLYATEKGCLLGANEEFMSSPKIDNLASVYTGLIGLLEAEENQDRINIFVAFDNEEIGKCYKCKGQILIIC